MTERRRRSQGDDHDARADRAVSITVNYVITLSITAVLISGLLIGASAYVESQRDRVVREELDVISQGLAAGIDDADRLSRADAESRSVRVGVDLPRRVAGESYQLRITEIANPPDQPAQYELTLRSAQSDVSVTLTLSTLVPIQEGTVTGGPVVVRLDTAGPVLVIEAGDSTGLPSLRQPNIGGATI